MTGSTGKDAPVICAISLAQAKSRRLPLPIVVFRTHVVWGNRVVLGNSTDYDA